MFIEIYDVCNPYILINRYWFYGVSRISKVWGCVSRAQTDPVRKDFGGVFLEGEVQLPSFFGSSSQIKPWNCSYRDWARRRGMIPRSISVKSFIALSIFAKTRCKDDISLYVSAVTRVDSATCSSDWSSRKYAKRTRSAEIGSCPVGGGRSVASRMRLICVSIISRM